MRTLHVACMPYPTAQGTQALVGAMLAALHGEGHDAHLLVYAHGAATRSRDPEWLHRLRAVPEVTSERSGPSAGKVALDMQMIAALRRRWRRLGRCPVVAHNVEAALVARAARVGPRVYVAHTRFDTELPTYAPSAWASALRRLGAALDRAACDADAIGAVSPALAAHLGGTFLPPPWPTAAPAGAPGPHVLYAGNLDGYQGWEHVVEACAHADLPLLVATHSDPAPLRRFADRAALRDLTLTPLVTEADRERAHERCFVVAVPRRAPGGLPVKLLDALARDRPVVAMRRALAGLEPAGVVAVPDDEPRALADALRATRAVAPTGGRAWVASQLRPARFARALEATIGRSRSLDPVGSGSP